MNSTPNAKDVLIAHTDEQLARARERIASVREGIARVTEELSKIEQNDARPAARGGDDARDPLARPDPQPRQGKAPQPRRGKSALPDWIGLLPAGLLPIGLLLAACLIVAALVSLLSRDAVTLIADRWTSQGVSTSSSQTTTPQLSAQPGSSFKLIAAEAAPAQAAPLAQTGPQNAAPAQAAPLAATAPQGAAPAAAGGSELTQLQQTTARDVASLRQENEQLKAQIEQLKVKQGQMASDNAKAIEQLKAKLDDMSRQVAKVSEQSALPKTPPPSAEPARSLQARMRLQAPPPPRRRYPPRWYYDDEW
jgi:uncharacterized phage infection (PIP) family protein YhgE